MQSRRVLALVLLTLLLPIPLPVAAAAPGVVGPDAEGAYQLLFDVAREEAGTVRLAFDVLRSDADGDLAGSRDLGLRALAAGTNALNLTFLPAEGAGHYVVGLLVDGVRIGERAFDVSDASASGTIAFDVADEPTFLNLTAEEVNADGKVKSPGDVLVTRATLSDGNGLSDVGSVTWSVVGPGFSDAGTLAVNASLELRYDRSPIPAGNHTLTLRALRDGATLASASRTFQIRDVAPTFVSGELPNVVPDEARTIATLVVLADKNGFPTAPLETRVYRASTRVEGAGFSATLGNSSPLPDAGGAAREAFPHTLVVPAFATPGAYRVSIYANGSLLGSMPFSVLELPTLTNVTSSTEGGALVLTALGTGNGTLRATLGNATASALFENGSATVRFEPTERNATLAWTAALHARADGPALATRNGTWAAPFDGPSLTLTPLHVRGRLPAAWLIESPWNLSTAQVESSVVRWDGAPEPRLTAQLVGDRARVEGPVDIEAGRYTARMVLTWPNGSASEATWSFDAGPWAQVSLGEPVVTGRVARVPLHNDGGLVVRRLVVEAEPAVGVALEVGNATWQPSTIGGRAAFSGFELAPGASGALRVELPSGPLAAGRHDVKLRVLARVELG